LLQLTQSKGSRTKGKLITLWAKKVYASSQGSCTTWTRSKKEAYGCGSTCDCTRKKVLDEAPWLSDVEYNLDLWKNQALGMDDIDWVDFELMSRMAIEKEKIDELRKSTMDMLNKAATKQPASSAALNKLNSPRFKR